MQELGSQAGDVSRGTFALIGLGAIGTTVAEEVARLPGMPVLKGALVRRKSAAAGIPVFTELDRLLAQRPELVVETAGQPSVREHGGPVLAAGVDLMLISSGALADDGLRAELLATAKRSGAHLLVPAGATGGLDVLSALCIQEMEEVTYISVKPPQAWRGTPAEAWHDLEKLLAMTVIFDGSAREAALAFPRNANLAATVALAGVGLDRTRVRLVADPSATGNANRIEALGAGGRMSIEIQGPALAGNPKSSRLAALSIVNALRNRWATLKI